MKLAVMNKIKEVYYIWFTLKFKIWFNTKLYLHLHHTWINQFYLAEHILAPSAIYLNPNPVSNFNFPSSKDSRWKSRRAWNEYFMMVFETDYWFRSMQLISWKHPWQITSGGKLHLPETHMTTINLALKPLKVILF